MGFKNGNDMVIYFFILTFPLLHFSGGGYEVAKLLAILQFCEREKKYTNEKIQQRVINIQVLDTKHYITANF